MRVSALGTQARPQPESAHGCRPASSTLPALAPGQPSAVNHLQPKAGSASSTPSAHTHAVLGGTSLVSGTEPPLGQQLTPEPTPAPKAAET